MLTLKMKVWKRLGKVAPRWVRKGMVGKVRLGKFKLVLL